MEDIVMQSKRLRLTALFVSAFCLAMTVYLPSWAAEKETLLLGSGGIAGHYYFAGGAIASFINRTDSEAGIRCAVVPSVRASGENVAGLIAGTLDLGLVQSDVQYNAYEGKGTYKGSEGAKKLRALFSLYSEAFTVVTRTDTEIETFQDLKGRKVSIGSPGASYRIISNLLMDEYGWTDDSIAHVDGLSPDAAAEALFDGKVDGFVYVIGHPWAVLTNAAAGRAFRVIPVEGREVESLMDKHPFYRPAVIPGKIYPGVESAVKTFGPKATLMTTSEMPDETAYLIVKAIFENCEDFKKTNSVFMNLDKEEMLGGNSAPLHPGAVRYYKEAGLMK
jgi:TRAP transporter TAXI family solute receptor